MTLLRVTALLILLAVPALAGGSKKTFTWYEIGVKEGTNFLPTTRSFAYNYELRRSVNGKNIGSSTGFCAALSNFKTTIVDGRNSSYCIGTLYTPEGTISYAGWVSETAFVDTVVTLTGGTDKYAGITGTAVQTKQSNATFPIFKYTFAVQYR